MARRPVKHTAKHPGFKAEAAAIKRRDPGIRNPNAVLASAARNASPEAKKANPRLKRVAMPKRRK